MEFSEIVKLLPCLKSCGVESFKDGRLEIRFAKETGEDSARVRRVADWVAAQPPLTVPLKASSNATSPITTEKVEDVVVPNRLEDEIPYDKILHWSSGGEESAGDTPLTDDAEVSNGG